MPSVLGGWAGVLEASAAEEATARRLIGQLAACEVAALAFCRLLERWARGDAEPSTPGQRQAALRRAAERAETALAGLDQPLGRYLLELESDRAEGRSWYGEPGAGELQDWHEVLERAGVVVSPGAGVPGVPRARRARPGARGTARGRRHRLGARPLVALGRPVRPPREPARANARRPARDRRLIPVIVLRHEPVVELVRTLAQPRHVRVTARLAALIAEGGGTAPHPGWGTRGLVWDRRPETGS